MESYFFSDNLRSVDGNYDFKPKKCVKYGSLLIYIIDKHGFDKLKEVLNYHNVKNKHNLLNYHLTNNMKPVKILLKCDKFYWKNLDKSYHLKDIKKFNPVLEYVIKNYGYSEIDYIINQVLINPHETKWDYINLSISFKMENDSYHLNPILGSIIKLFQNNYLTDKIKQNIIYVLNFIINKMDYTFDVIMIWIIIIKKLDQQNLYKKFKNLLDNNKKFEHYKNSIVYDLKNYFEIVY